jgi:hypothetical protein
MRRLVSSLTISCAEVALTILAAPAPAADTGGTNATNGTIDGAGKTAESPTADNGNGAAGEGSESSATSGAAPVTGPDEPNTLLKPPLPPLHLTDTERQQIREAVADKDTEVTFQLKNTKPLKGFKASIGEKIPPHLPAHALPSALTQKLPALADYKYVKVDKQVLIVNPMTKKIVDMFPESQG